MPDNSITLENMQFHCRTCLNKLQSIETNNSSKNGEEKSLDHKDISTDIALQALITSNLNVIDETFEATDVKVIKLCLDCFKILNDFELWRKKAIKCAYVLHDLFDQQHTIDAKAKKSKEMVKESRKCKNKQTVELAQIEAVNLCESSNYSEDIKYDVPAEDPFDRQSIPPKAHTIVSERKTTSSRKAAAYRCVKCAKRFVHRLYYEAHMRQVHERVPLPYICEHCGKAYKGITSLKYHRYVAHKLGTQTFPCNVCGHQYKTQASLKRHHSSVHLGQKPSKRFICEHCGATFLNSRALLIHNQAKHSGCTAYKCTHCAKEFQSPYTLNYHVMRAHQPQQNYMCRVCSLGFGKKFMLVAHMRSHASEDEKFACEQCERRFNSKADRQKHVRVVHLQLKPYICADCGDAFGSAKTLRHHVYIHTGEKPYVCEVCGIGFRQLTAMKTHRKKHENTTHELKCI